MLILHVLVGNPTEPLPAVGRRLARSMPFCDRRNDGCGLANSLAVSAFVVGDGLSCPPSARSRPPFPGRPAGVDVERCG